jgi:hypothetical protein
MSTLQKSALFELVIALLTIVAYASLALIVDPLAATAAFAITALIALEPVLFRRQRTDERERQLIRRAGVTAGMASYLVVVVACMGVWAARFRGPDPRIDVAVLPGIVMIAAVTLLLVRAITLLFLANRSLEAGG